MQSPSDFAAAYTACRQTAEALQKAAGKQLYLRICRPNEWLFADRVKEEESALSKLQLGPVSVLAEMNDLYAAVIVVPTTAEIEGATRAIQNRFPDTKIVPRDPRDPRRFAYNDVHLLVKLGPRAPGDQQGLANLVFEVQIHSGLQYAWWRATHDTIYKGEQSWALLRVASQVRASLELLDGVLADLKGSAERLGVTETAEDIEFERVVGWMEKWPERLRPADTLRFFQQVRELSRLKGVGLDHLETWLGGPYGAELIANENLTPLQTIIGLIAKEKGGAHLGKLREGRYLLVTKELEDACSEAADIPVTVRTSLTF